MFNEKGNYQYPGDMVKSTYDSNNDGVVNAADTVPWSGVTNTPDSLSGYGIEEVPASVLSGVIGIEHIPPSAVERMKIVENDSMRFALTTADVQNGDTVKVTATNKMYLVVDDGNLDSESGYMVYVAGRAAAVDWTGVENKPETIENIDDILDTSEEESDEGNPITLVTDSAQMAKSTKLTFEPIQDLHGYDHPWPAGGGKNLFDKSAVTNGYYIESNGTITETLGWGVSDYMPVTKGNYIASGYATTGSGVYLAVYNANKEYIRSVGMIISEPTTTVVTISTGEAYVRMSVRIYASEQNTAQFEKGSTATSYEPYSNICPISGVDEVEVKRTGFNLWDEVAETGWVNTSTGANQNANDALRSKNYIEVLPNTSYHISTKYTANNQIPYTFWYDTDKNYIGKVQAGSGQHELTVTSATNARYMRFGVANLPTPVTYNHDICINLSDPQRNGQYEPYHGTEVTSSLPETVYGGTLDLETGVVVADMALVKVSDLTWFRDSQYNKSSSLAYLIKPVATNSEKSSAIMSCYMTIPWNDTDDMSFSVSIQGRISVTDSRYSTVNDWLSNVANEQIVYELATPVTYHLTPKQLALFKGTNVVQTNAKSVKVTYRNGKLALMDDIPQQLEIEEAKTDEKIDAKAVELLSLFAPIENGTTASQAYTTGKYFIHDGLFCKAKTSIASGATFTLNTNYEVTTVGAEIYTALHS